MNARITIHARPEKVFAWLAAEENIPFWFAHLRHAAEVLPDPGLTAEPGTLTVRWSVEPPGSMQVSGTGEAAILALAFEDHEGPIEAPVGDELPDDPLMNAGNALRSIKSHVEAAGGGDPDLPMPGVISREQVAEAERELAEERRSQAPR